MTNLGYLAAKSYTDIPNRSTDLDNVRRELNVIINSQPTQLYPEERERYLDALLDDIEDRENAPWTKWPADVHLLCVNAIKVLSRNPIGSQTLSTPTRIRTLIHQAALPCSLPISPFSRPPFPSTSPQALEAFRILANVLILHPSAREVFASLGGTKAIARELADKNENGEYCLEDVEECIDRVFLLGRCAFLVTVNRKEDVKMLVDKEDIIDSLCYHLTATSPIPANFQALSELLKLATNILTFYPYKSTNRDEPWDERFDNLLWPTLCLLHTIPFRELLPPLSHVINVLFIIPFNARLIATWQSVPEIPSPTSSSSVRNLINRISNISHISSSSSSSTGRKPSFTEQLIPSRSRTPSPLSSVRAKRTINPLPKKNEPTALVDPILKVVDEFIETYISLPKLPNDFDGEEGVRFDEVLPPALLVMSKAARGNETMRVYLKDAILPSDLDRSAEAGPLERRKSLLGSLIRFMGCSHHPQTKDTAGELLWSVCGEDASTLSAEIGYGNAAGVLFQKGITAPPPGKISEIPDVPAKQPPTPPANPSVNPITGVENLPDESQVLRNMTEEEKEREAERLFSLFDRMDKNPVISTRGPDGEKKGIKDVMRERYADVDKSWGEKERKETEEEEKRDEEEVRKEMEAYRRRMGRN